MPCQDYPPTSHVNEGYTKTINNQNKRLNEYARMLCAACKQLDPSQLANLPEVNKWWEQHQKDDRKEQERVATAQRKKDRRQRALAKLTPEDRQALGL